jgi:hypothetical protein
MIAIRVKENDAIDGKREYWLHEKKNLSKAEKAIRSLFTAKGSSVVGITVDCDDCVIDFKFIKPKKEK